MNLIHKEHMENYKIIEYEHRSGNFLSKFISLYQVIDTYISFYSKFLYWLITCLLKIST